LEKYVSTLDVHRMSKEGLFNYIVELLSGATIEILKRFDEKDINHQIVTTMLKTIKPLPQKFVKPLSVTLLSLANNDEMISQQINHSLIWHKKIFLWEKYKIAAMLLFTILICLLIYFTNK
jgi:hypothetical protein